MFLFKQIICMQMLQTKSELVLLSAAIKEWHKRPNQNILFSQKSGLDYGTM
jgi:hypothetical protein